jgi:3-oxoacyl-ACP reductase-like protein
MPNQTIFPDENDDALDKIVSDKDLEPNQVSPEDRRRQYDEREGREINEIPRPSEDGDDADDENDREF